MRRAGFGAGLCLGLAACLGLISPPHGRPPEIVRADAALVLSGDQGYLRIARAVALEREGAVSFLLLTGAGAGGDSAAVLEAIALQAGVPENRIVCENRSRTTRENLLFSVPLARARGWRRIALVTSEAHMGRAERAARRLAPEITWVPVPVTDFGSSLTIYGTRLREWLKLSGYATRGWS